MTVIFIYSISRFYDNIYVVISNVDHKSSPKVSQSGTRVTPCKRGNLEHYSRTTTFKLNLTSIFHEQVWPIASVDPVVVGKTQLAVNLVAASLQYFIPLDNTTGLKVEHTK